MSNKDLDTAWAAAGDNPGKAIDIGRIVVCDFCNDDYTESQASGGLIFGSYALCPQCQHKVIGEASRVRARCPEWMSFADFVREYRGGNTTITISSLPRSGQS